MEPAALAERNRIESEILSYVREAVLTALNSKIESPPADQWCERCRFLVESYRRHIERLYRIKWDIDDQLLALELGNPKVIDDLAAIAAEQRARLADINLLSYEAKNLSGGNLANLYAFRQRVLGFVQRFNAICELEAKTWIDVFHVDIGGEG